MPGARLEEPSGAAEAPAAGTQHSDSATRKARRPAVGHCMSAREPAGGQGSGGLPGKGPRAKSARRAG